MSYGDSKVPHPIGLADIAAYVQELERRRPTEQGSSGWYITPVHPGIVLRWEALDRIEASLRDGSLIADQDLTLIGQPRGELESDADMRARMRRWIDTLDEVDE